MNIMERRRQSFFTLCLSIVKELGASNARATFKPIVRKKWHFSYSLTLLFVFFALLRGCHIITVGRFEVYRLQSLLKIGNRPARKTKFLKISRKCLISIQAQKFKLRIFGLYFKLLKCKNQLFKIISLGFYFIFATFFDEYKKLIFALKSKINSKMGLYLVIFKHCA